MTAQAPPVFEFLHKEELRQLTGAAHAKTQAKWLQEQGIPHRVDHSRVIVSRYHVREWLEGKERAVGSGGINWAALGETVAERREREAREEGR